MFLFCLSTAIFVLSLVLCNFDVHMCAARVHKTKFLSVTKLWEIHEDKPAKNSKKIIKLWNKYKCCDKIAAMVFDTTSCNIGRGNYKINVMICDTFYISYSTS